MTDTYISIDLETTGLEPKHEKIIEIGALKVVDGQVADTFSAFVNPGRQLTERIVELTGIQDAQLADAPYIEDVFPALTEFLEDMPILGHSVLFDYSFLKKAAVDQRIEFEKNGIDTLKIARKFLADLEHRSLDHLCDHYQIEHRAHRALEDARATHVLYRKLAELFDDGEDNLFDPAPLQYQVKRDVPATKAQKEQLYRLLEKHRISLGADVERLSRSEASRFYDKIRSNPAAYQEKAPSPGDQLP